MSDFEAVIGLEVHAQLATRSKLFCPCPTTFGQEPNTNVCPVCGGMPGMLPALNRQAVLFAVTAALATGCAVNPRSIFARKNYFYPDLPKGYQISQYELPVAERGHLDIVTDAGAKRIGITRIHMEDDAGKSIHSASESRSFVDLNRSGVPLIEIVSEPDLRSPEEAAAYLKALHEILLCLGVSDGNMEEGSFRCDANVSLRPRGEAKLGTRTELKNMNSFRNVQRAIACEIARQEDLLLDGEEVVQETRLFDAERGVTLPMRGKEEAHDYRYFPDPDLLPVEVPEELIERLRAALPELPAARRERLTAAHGLSAQDAAVLTSDKALADWYEAAVLAWSEPKKLANWTMTEVLSALNARGAKAADIRLAPAAFAGLVRAVEEGAINAKAGKELLREFLLKGGDPVAAATERGLGQISDAGALEAAVAEVVAAHPAEAGRYKAGEKKLTGFFVGQEIGRASCRERV